MNSSATSLAQSAFNTWRSVTHTQRAHALEAIADALDGAVATLVPLADQESHLGVDRLTGEVARTTFQFRMFAHALREGTLFPTDVDPAVPGAPPVGHPTLQRTYLPLGVVAIFGASNFPFAFGELGGDTASALAAGCCVVVKEHPAHPQLAAQLIALARDALSSAGFPADVITSVSGLEAGAQLVAEPDIKAVGFTGSVPGGRFLYDIAVNRPHPIPFYGELGSVNPVVVTRAAAQSRADSIAQGFVDSLTLGAGQFCTKPAVLFVPEGSGITERAVEILNERAPMALLTTDIATRYDAHVEQFASDQSTLLLGGTPREDNVVSPSLFRADVSEFLDPNHPLRHECFGPSAVIVEYSTDNEAIALCGVDEGVLVSCIHADDNDPQAPALIDALAQRSGRLVWNGWPTGVAVTSWQMHGGPYPAATNPLHTSVGVTAAYRFARPIVWQDFPESQLRA
jgi:NADP-dependent aldehyde dehydrogenase